MKIQRQPTFSAIRPPKSAAKPAPPHDPIDHRLTARWRPAPSQYAFTSARLAGMMQAAESPWQMRPSIREGTAKRARRRQADQQRADDAEDEADLHDLHAPDSIGERRRRRR